MALNPLSRTGQARVTVLSITREGENNRWGGRALRERLLNLRPEGQNVGALPLEREGWGGGGRGVKGETGYGSCPPRSLEQFFD